MTKHDKHEINTSFKEEVYISPLRHILKIRRANLMGFLLNISEIKQIYFNNNLNAFYIPQIEELR